MWNRLRYTLWAPFYDAIVAAAGFGPTRRRSIEYLRLHPGHRVLIIGAGTGLDLAFLPPGTDLAHKTGSVSDARTDAGILYLDDGAVALCVLTAGNASGRHTRDADAAGTSCDTDRKRRDRAHDGCAGTGLCGRVV